MAPFKRPVPREETKREETLTPHGGRCLCIYCRSQKAKGK